MCIVVVPVSHCKDTYYFDKTNNFFFFNKVKEKGDQTPGLLCQKLTELLYYCGIIVPKASIQASFPLWNIIRPPSLSVQKYANPVGIPVEARGF